MTAVGVVGASARAAVHSLARAGHSAWAVDLFADRDLKRVAECAVCPPDRYPEAIPELASQFPPGPVLYTGGLENYPHVIRELASRREVWGTPPDVLARARDPFALFPSLAEAGFATPRLVPRGEACPAEGRWLRKPLRSGGGLGIRFARPREAASPHHYFQEFIEGVPMSALYCGTTLLTVTEQLVGEPRLHAKGFVYCGNIVPATTPEERLVRLLHLGRSLAGAFPMCEFWGVDFLLHDKMPTPVEINPRYTAAVEVLEHATRWAAFSKDPPPRPPSLQGGGRDSCSPLPAGRGAGGVGEASVGKAIYYAPHAIRFPHSGPWDADLSGSFDPWRLPGFADIPEAGGVVEPGHPVLTFFATGSTPAEVRERLQSRAAELDTLFRDSQP